MAPANGHVHHQDNSGAKPHALSHSRTNDYQLKDRSFTPHTKTPSKRDGRQDGTIPNPPPPYSPSISLHATIIPYNDAAPTLSPPTTPANSVPIFPMHMHTPHATNVGLLVGAVLAAIITLILLGALGRYLLHRKATSLRLSHPRFSMWLPKSAHPKVEDENSKSKEGEECIPKDFGQFVHGLGIVHKEQEVDIASTALSALERYSIAVDSTSPNIPLTSLFQIDNTGKVVGAQSSPAGAHTPSTPVSPSTSGSSSFTESSGDELIESAIIVRMAQARSMEIKRGMLVSMDFQHPPMSRSAPTLVDAQFISQKEEKHEYGLTSPPPSLSPIVPSPTSLSADIEQSLEERVFAYRGSGEWSKENYKLTTPGQVRALVEALAISKPVSVEQQPERGWPWPAQRQQEH